MNFTYYITDENSLIKSVRVTDHESGKYVLTVYYFYMSIVFGEDKDNIIFNWDKDHKLEYHQEDDPLDWHIHIKVKNKEDIVSKLKNLKQLKIKDINNLKKLLDGNKINSNNVQYEGTKNIKMYEKLKTIMKKERFDYHVIKNDVIDTKFLLLVFYFLRFSNLQFNITPQLLDKLKKDELIESTVIFNYNKPKEASKDFEEYRNLIITAFNDYKKEKRKVSLEYYMNLRLTVDLGWNIIKKDKIVAYFLFYKRFQNCFYVRKCKFDINLDDSLFKKMIERVDKKIKISGKFDIDQLEQLFFEKELSARGRVKSSPDANPNLDGGNPGTVV
jgi:hypothetical protein